MPDTNVRTPWILKILALLIVVALLCVVAAGIRARRNEERRAAWIKQAKQRGAKAVVASYADDGLLAKLPILDSLYVSRQLVLFIPSSDVAASVLELLPAGTDVRRIWLHRDNVSHDVIEEIHKVRPDVTVGRYTP